MCFNVFNTVFITLILLLTVIACKKFRKRKVVSGQESRVRFNDYSDGNASPDMCIDGGKLYMKEQELAEFANGSSDDQTYSSIDDIPPKKFNGSKTALPTGLDSDSPYIVPDVNPGLPQEAEVYEEVGNHDPALKNAMPYYQQRMEGCSTYAGMDEDVYTEIQFDLK